MRDRLLFCLCGAGAGFHAVVVWAALSLGESPARPIADTATWMAAAIWFALEIDVRSAAQKDSK